MSVGPLLGEQLLEIAQTNISKGNVEYGANLYINALHGFTKEYTMMLLKNEAVLITEEDGSGVRLSDWEQDIKANAHNIFDWNYIINKRIENLKGILSNLAIAEKEFHNYYCGDILNYSIIDMMLRYFDSEQLKSIGLHTIAARIIGSPDCTVCSKGHSNPDSIWVKNMDRIEYDPDNEDISNWQKVLYYTVRYNKLIRMLHKEYLNFENTYLFLVENGFIDRPQRIELLIENVMKTLDNFADTSKGYYHPLCNTGLYEYKETLRDDLCKTKFGKEYLQNGIIKKDIMDGYDAGWLSPDGEFYGGDGPTSAMIHLNIAEDIFDGNNVYANRMFKAGVLKMGGTNSPDYWLESHGWIKIHHNEIYGSFIGRDGEYDEDFPYPYCPTEIQIKMICNYADKFCNGKIHTQPQIVRSTEPVSTYKLRQMDRIQLHEMFGK